MSSLDSFDGSWSFQILEDDVERMVNFMDLKPKPVSRLEGISETFSLMERDRHVYYEIILGGNELKKLIFQGYISPRARIFYAERKIKINPADGFTFAYSPDIISGYNFIADSSVMEWFLATFSRKLIYSSLQTKIFYDFSPTQVQTTTDRGARADLIVNKSWQEFDVRVIALDKQRNPISKVIEGPAGTLLPEMKAVRLNILRPGGYEVIGEYGGANFLQKDFKSICLDHNHIPVNLLYESPIFYDRSLRPFRQIGVRK